MAALPFSPTTVVTHPDTSVPNDNNTSITNSESVPSSSALAGPTNSTNSSSSLDVESDRDSCSELESQDTNYSVSSTSEFDSPFGSSSACCSLPTVAMNPSERHTHSPSSGVRTISAAHRFKAQLLAVHRHQQNLKQTVFPQLLVPAQGSTAAEVNVEDSQLQLYRGDHVPFEMQSFHLRHYVALIRGSLSPAVKQQLTYALHGGMNWYLLVERAWGINRTLRQAIANTSKVAAGSAEMDEETGEASGRERLLSVDDIVTLLRTGQAPHVLLADEVASETDTEQEEEE